MSLRFAYFSMALCLFWGFVFGFGFKTLLGDTLNLHIVHEIVVKPTLKK